jgi:hypothetical protein
MLTLDDKFYRRLTYFIFGIIAVIMVMTFRDYGITWDEELQSQYGQAVVDYYFSGFKDQRYAEIFNLYLYGGMFDGLASLIDRFTPFSVYETRHLVNAFFGLLGLWGTWRIGRFLGGPVVGLMSLILLALTPVYYGHMFNNPKDIPFAAGILWAIYFMSRCMAELPRPKPAILIKLGIILGLTMGVRVGGVMLLLFWLAPMGVGGMAPLWTRRNKKTALAETIKTLWSYGWRIVLPVTVLTYVVMLICWPWAQQHPIANPLRALSEFSNFPQDVEVLLDGKIYRSTQLPWTYVPLYFGVQLSEFLLVLLGLGVVSLPWIVRDLNVPRRQSLGLILLMALVPTSYAMIRHPALYDAVRHFQFVVPLACIFAALAARHVYGVAIGAFHQGWSRRLIASSLITIFALSAMTQIFIMVKLHPYEYIYANRFTGGVAGAYDRYELDYWGTSFKEAAHRIQALVASEGGVPSGKIYKVAICGPWDAAMIYLPPDYEPVQANEPAEFFLSTTRWMCQNMRPGKEVITIDRMGVPLAVVKDLRGGFEYYPGNEK